MFRIITLLVFFLPLIGFSQSFSGKITDIRKQPIEGAYIINISSEEHAHTNQFGQFTINKLKTGDTLYISHIGYESINFVVNLDSEIIIRMIERSINLDEIMVSPELDAINLFTTINIQTNPVNSSQEILRKVPGIVIGQHAGGGKAEQIFLRGFDVDHGTDINITVDGMPVNMVSHAHGQGYADLHFLIPETIENLNFGKGPYYTDQGNFNTAGYVSFKTYDKLAQSRVKLEAGQFNTQRMLGMFNILENEDHAAYVATEYLSSDGPFDSPQNFDRINVMGKYTGYLSNNDKITFLTSLFSSRWDASGQVPQRAVDSGSISRFGAIDNTEGGQTSRINFLFDHVRNISNQSLIKNTVYFVNYDFELFSNFTFFLNDPLNGDQIKQKENRTIFGLKSEYNQSFHVGRTDGTFQAGIGLRKDQVLDNELSHTRIRLITLDSIQLGDINETNLYGYMNANFVLGRWTFNPGIRFDQFNFNYHDRLLTQFVRQTQSTVTASPKLNILYNPTNKLQLYLKSGKGFHSNDTRVVVAQNGNEILPAAWGSDLGMIWKPLDKLFINTALWHLYLEQEFVYVGDEGIVEPSGRTSRSGFDLSLRYQPVSWLYWDADLNQTLARAIDEPEGSNYIPLAPDFTVMSGVSVIHPSGTYGGIRLRYVKSRPANEDNSIVALGYAVVDLNAGYQWKNLDFGINIQNLLNTEWNETQFATESRLFNELIPVEEIHFTPGTPFFLKGSVSYSF
ncbi:MAG: TonB-dependent receptor [Bacteroidota bacterium]